MKSIKNKYFFFLLRIIKDITNPTVWGISNDLTSGTLGEYYFLFDESQMENQKGGQKSIIYDGDGIAMNPTYIDVKDKKYVYFPITIGQVGLSIFHTYLKTKSEQDKNRFLNYADWFVKNSIHDKKLGTYWLTEVALPQYKNPGPWQSAFVQSRAISVLLRAYQITNDETYKTMAREAIKPFKHAVSEGGVTSYTKYGPMYEEYTASVPTLVLNGMIFSMCGLFDYARVFPDDTEVKKLVDDGISSLINIIPQYDLGFWSKYNLVDSDWYPHKDPSTITYQHLHITQMNFLYAITGNDIFKKYAVKFKKQINLVNIGRMYLLKYKALKKLGRV